MTERVCGSCGAVVAATSTFCTSCGTALPAAPAADATTPRNQPPGQQPPVFVPPTAPPPPDPSPTTGAPPAGALPAQPAPREPRSGASPVLILGVIAGVAVVAVLALAAGIFLGSSSDDSSDQATELPVATSAAPLPTVTEAPTTVTTESAGLEPLVIELDGILHRSANGREAIVEVIGGVTAECRYEPDDAADRISTVLDNRRSIRQELLDLDTVDSEGAQLVALYDAALVASIESNEHYVDWVWRSYSVARQDADDCFVPQGDDFVDAVEDSDRATAAKKEFVAAYNPVAERYGLRVWSDTDF